MMDDVKESMLEWWESYGFELGEHFGVYLWFPHESMTEFWNYCGEHWIAVPDFSDGYYAAQWLDSLKKYSMKECWDLGIFL